MQCCVWLIVCVVISPFLYLTASLSTCLILLVAAGNFRSHASHFIIHSSWRWNHPPPQCLLCQADTKMRSAVRGKRVLQTFQQMYHWNCGVGRCLCLVGGARWWCLVHDVLCWFSQEFFPASLVILIPGTSQCRVWRRNPFSSAWRPQRPELLICATLYAVRRLFCSCLVVSGDILLSGKPGWRYVSWGCWQHFREANHKAALLPFCLQWYHTCPPIWQYDFFRIYPACVANSGDELTLFLMRSAFLGIAISSLTLTPCCES